MKRKVLFGAFGVALAGLVACSDTGADSQNQTVNRLDGTLDESVAYDAVGLWRSLADKGVAEYFDSVSTENETYFVAKPEETGVRKCSSSALSMDADTRYMDELENLYREGHLVDGVCGKALSLKSGQVAPLGINLVDSMKTGTVEFWFRPGKDFYDERARTLLGNDESRLHFFVKDGKLVFQKNHADKHFFVQGSVELNEGWNKIGGQWGDGYMSLWLNDTLVARKEHSEGYAPSLRDVTFGNLLVIGFKTGCCMEAVGQYEGMTTSGDFDQVRISKSLRYDNGTVAEIPVVVPETPVVVPEDVEESSSSEAVEESSSSVAEIEESSSSEAEEVVSEKSITNCVNLDCEAYVDGEELSVTSSDFVKLDWLLDENIPKGAMSFKFKPNENFENSSRRFLIGNDEGRLLFYYVGDSLIFAKNWADRHTYVSAYVTFDDWTEVVGQWGDGVMALYVNGELVAKKSISNDSYEASIRTAEGNRIVIGEKSYCCMAEASSTLRSEGFYKDIKISDWIYDIE